MWDMEGNTCTMWDRSTASVALCGGKQNRVRWHSKAHRSLLRPPPQCLRTLNCIMELQSPLDNIFVSVEIRTAYQLYPVSVLQYYNISNGFHSCGGMYRRAVW
uniref:Uncharacterized protein n=1 Tax=Schizaphis graminum TaxID=13262 RepID=A0A2S2PCG5_SCHGA